MKESLSRGEYDGAGPSGKSKLPPNGTKSRMSKFEGSKRSALFEGKCAAICTCISRYVDTINGIVLAIALLMFWLLSSLLVVTGVGVALTAFCHSYCP